MSMQLKAIKRPLNTIWYIILILFCLYAVYGYLTSSSKHERTVTRIQEIENGVIFHLDDEQAYLVDFDAKPYNRRNLVLFYEGKRVWVVGAKDRLHITPVEQESMPALTVMEYNRLIKEGFLDSDIKYSYRIPKGVKNPNKETRTYGGLIAHGAPGVCGEELR